MCVCVCKYVYAWNNVGLKEFTRHSRGTERTHHYSGTHTKSSTMAIKSKAISLLLAIHTRSAFTHAWTFTWRQLKTTHIQYTALLLGYFKSVERSKWYSHSTSPPNRNKMCQQWEYNISEWELFGKGDMERNQFQGQVWCQGRPEGHSSVDLFISICSLLQTENATACSAASLRNIALITVS